MEKDLNERILYFKEYCALMFRAVKERFWQMFGSMLLFTLFMILATLGIIFIGAIIIAYYLPYSYLTNVYALQYIDSSAILSQIAPAIPAMIGIGLIWIIVIMFFACAQNAMIYLIADSVACKEKRDFGSMLSFAFRRAFPSLGTAVLLMLIGIGIFIVFGILLSIIFASAGFSIYTIYALDISTWVQSGNMAIFTVIFIVLSLIMIIISIYISIMYSMGQLARVKYKFSAISSLRYSRMLTKSKRGKIFGNLLLIGIFYGILVFLLSMISENISNVYIPLLSFVVIILVDLVSGFASYMLYIFAAFIFINFDKLKGESIRSTFNTNGIDIKEKYFPDSMKHDVNVQNSTDEIMHMKNEDMENLYQNNIDNPVNADIINQKDMQDDQT